MSNKKSYAEQALEAVQTEQSAAEAAVEENYALVSTDTSDEDEFVQVGGLEPAAFYYRFSPPKPGKEPKQPWKLFEPGQTIQGTYVRGHIGGKFNQLTAYVRLEANGPLIGLPSSGAITKAFSQLEEGCKFKFTYHGMAEIKGGQWAGSDAHTVTVLGTKVKQK